MLQNDRPAESGKLGSLLADDDVLVMRWCGEDVVEVEVVCVGERWTVVVGKDVEDGVEDVDELVTVDDMVVVVVVVDDDDDDGDDVVVVVVLVVVVDGDVVDDDDDVLVVVVGVAGIVVVVVDGVVVVVVVVVDDDGDDDDRFVVDLVVEDGDGVGELLRTVELAVVVVSGVVVVVVVTRLVVVGCVVLDAVVVFSTERIRNQHASAITVFNNHWLHENMTSSRKPEVHNVSQHRQRRTKPRC